MKKELELKVNGSISDRELRILTGQREEGKAEEIESK